MSLLVAAQILLSMMFLVSGVAKLPDPTGTEDAMRSLRVPGRAGHALAARLVPVAEIAGSALIWIPWPPSQIMLACAQLLLAVTYLVLIARALRFPDPVHCSCFGRLGSPTVSGAILLRNALLVLLAVLALVGAVSGQLGSVLVGRPSSLLGSALALTLAIALTVFTVRSTAVSGTDTEAGVIPSSGGGPRQGTGADTHSRSERPTDTTDTDTDTDTDEILDYERSPTPFGVLRTRDGTVLTLAEATDLRAVLLVFVRPGCGPCERVLDQVAAWRAALVGVIDLLVVLPRPLETAPAGVLGCAGAGAVHDIERNVAAALGVTGTPAAVLLGADQELAGGPVTGASDVQEFVQEIITQVSGLNTELATGSSTEPEA